MVQDALNKGKDPSSVYPHIPNVNVQLQAHTLLHLDKCPSYLVLAKTNWDYFGEDACTAYNACHSATLQVAADRDLQLAYAMNAFSNHFL
ncbi:hypothetical protein CTA1_12965 [Colletotrichum tanaceti]|uniref:Uncharacterized protein n=1 Tax=Colletotrichum tanaceti TaxID=1306861 RepID=A0A4U6X0K5_9PEZI|nr:hypothetical protein CTA1_12965 [Colletotrichum tanaceti]